MPAAAVMRGAVRRMPAATARGGVAGAVALLLDAGEQEHLVVHGQAVGDAEHQHRDARLDRAGGGEAEGAGEVAVLEIHTRAPNMTDRLRRFSTVAFSGSRTLPVSRKSRAQVAGRVRAANQGQPVQECVAEVGGLGRVAADEDVMGGGGADGLDESGHVAVHGALGGDHGQAGGAVRGGHGAGVREGAATRSPSRWVPAAETTWKTPGTRESSAARAGTSRPPPSPRGTTNRVSVASAAKATRLEVPSGRVRWSGRPKRSPSSGEAQISSRARAAPPAASGRRSPRSG
jgi:hypothetical protein